MNIYHFMFKLTRFISAICTNFFESTHITSCNCVNLFNGFRFEVLVIFNKISNQNREQLQ